MNDALTISAGHLKAIDEVLTIESPDLRHHVTAIGRCGPLTSGPLQRGQSIFHIYPVELRAEDASAILLALKSAEQKMGDEQKLFSGFQLAGLVHIWACINAALQEKRQIQDNKQQ
jgi:hypothetical protein